jgi:hypothetical protein
MFKVIEFDFDVTISDWEELIYYLKKKDNKIYGLDFSKPELRYYFTNFIKYMSMNHMYLYFDYINFGTVNMSSRKLIKLANFLLKNYSKDENSVAHPHSMIQYILC